MRDWGTNCARMIADPETTDDAVLGGRLRLLQPKRGHRFGHDAVLLAAAVDARSGEHVAEFGAGVGLAGLALAWRVSGLRVTLCEIDEDLCALARENAERNNLSDRVDIVRADVTEIALGAVDHVMMNPPYNDARRHRGSPDARRAAAYVAGEGLLADWCAAAARVLGAGGGLTLIWRADDLDTVHAALAPDFGAVGIRPVRTRADGGATLVLVDARKGAERAVTTRPALRLAGPDGRPSVEAERILREALSIDRAIGAA